jgi:type I restriction enzyme S subunit
MSKKTNVIVPGYKSSPLGPIPEDWEVKRFDEFAPLQRGFDLPVDNIIDGKYPVVFSNGILKYHKEFKALKPGVVTGRSGTIGKVCFVEQDYWPHNTSLWVTDFLGNEPKFVFYYIVNFDVGRFSSGSGVPTLNRNDVHSQKIIVPPILEQKAIVNVLSTWDEAIQATTELIKAKERQKKYLMQNLLSGKMRLEKFLNKKWSRKTLADCLTYTPREISKPSESFFALGIRSHAKGIFHKNNFEPEDLASDILYEVKKDDLIVNITFAWEHAIAIAGTEDDGGLVSHRFPTYTFNLKDAIPEFFRHYILQKSFKYQLVLISPGGAGRNRVMSKKDFLKIEVVIPDTVEQNAIAEILNMSDKEIKLLKVKLEGLKEQKKGLMQQLLTGKKRLKITTPTNGK